MTPDDLAFLESLLKTRCGLGLRGDKGYFAESRLAPVARRENLSSADALVEQMRTLADDRLAAAAMEALTVTDTAFFRDGPVFQYIAADLLPQLAAASPDRALQVWSAGCSTGQEAYSLAMLSQDASPQVRIEVVATDLSERVLEKAHAGLYTQFEVQRGLPIRSLLKHFEKAGEMWSISPRLRAMVRWRRLNLAEARRSLRPFDLILCRHVLAYFEAAMRERVLVQLAASLAPGGWLVLGPEDAAPAGFAAGGAPGVFRMVAEAGRAAA